MSLNSFLRKKSQLVWFIPFTTLLSMVCIAPFLWIAINSFKESEESFGFGLYKEVFTNAFYLQSLKNALVLSLVSSLLGLFISLIVVNSITRVPNKFADWVLSFTNMSSHLSGVPLAFAFVIIMGTNGVVTLFLKSIGLLISFSLYSIEGLYIIYTYFQIPLGILLLYPAFNMIDAHWKEASKLLGASSFYYIKTILLPILLPSILSTFVMLMANALGAYATAYALSAGNINLLVVRISSLVVGDIFLNPTLAAALSMILMFQLVFITALNQFILRKSYAHKN